MTCFVASRRSNYWAADLAAASDWYSELLGMEPYFQRAELDGRIIGPDDPDYERAHLGYVEFRIGDYQHELGLIDSRYAPGGPPSSTGGACSIGTSTMCVPRSRSCCLWGRRGTCRSPSRGAPDS